MRTYALFVIAACSSAPAPVPEQAPPGEPAIVPLSPDPWAHTWAPPSTAPSSPITSAIPIAPPVIAGPVRTEVIVDPAPGPRVHSISGSIELLAITEDARSALTASDSHSVRLWPTLDGKREPIVLEMRPPSMLAITRDHDAFVLAGVDSVGQLEIVNATRTGEVTKRIELGIERPIISVRATSGGVIALRDDSVATLVGLDGEIRAELATESGEHLGAIAVRGGRAIAIIESDDRVRGRWIDLATASWGAWTPALPIKADAAVLSANGERLAAFRKKGHKAVSIVKLATGKVVDTITDLPEDAGIVGFITSDEVAVSSAGRSWWTREDTGTSIEGRPFAAANGLLVGGQQTAIVIGSPTEQTTYVGYRIGVVTQVQPKRDGFLVTDGQSLVELDARFRTRAGFGVVELAEGIGQAVLVDGEHALGFSYSRKRSLYLISTKAPSTTLVVSDVVTYGYEPTTRLLYYATSANDYAPDTERVYAMRFDPENEAFGPAVEIPGKRGQIYLLPAGNAKREIAIMVPTGVPRKYKLTYATIGDAFETTSESEIEGSMKWWNEIGDPRALIREVGTRTRNPDRSMTAVVRDQRLELRLGKSVRWTVPSRGITQVVWTPRGELVAIGAGLARVDLATGDLRDRQCGSWFGRWDYRPDVFAFTTLCEVP